MFPQPDAITPNTAVARLRAALQSPHRSGQPMSRGEFAETVSEAIDRLSPHQTNQSLHVDARWVGRLERGEIRWPGKERRAALRDVLGVDTDTDLGLCSVRSGPTPRNLSPSPEVPPKP